MQSLKIGLISLHSSCVTFTRDYIKIERLQPKSQQSKKEQTELKLYLYHIRIRGRRIGLKHGARILNLLAKCLNLDR